MISETFIVIAFFVLGFGFFSRRLQSTVITSPMAFVVFGILIGLTQLLEIDIESEAIRLLAEVTLVLILFSDASRIDIRVLLKEYSLALRMLVFGVPLTILFGVFVAIGLFPEFTFWEACVVAAILAPTDAALGQAVVTNHRIPVRIRQTLNVESGLNDGISFPAVLILLALATTINQDLDANYWTGFIGGQLILGPIVGIIVGYLGGQLIVYGTKIDWMDDNFQRLSGVAVALLAFSVAELVGGNGFISAFVAGLTFGNTAKMICHCVHEFAEAEGQFLTLITFMIFGALMVIPTFNAITIPMLIYALLSLTVVRMLPIALSLLGEKLQLDTILFLGWFGPRGIASIIFALLILEESDHLISHEPMFHLVVVTVFISIFAHGLTAVPWANAYGNKADSMKDEDMPEFEPIDEMPLRINYDEA